MDSLRPQCTSFRIIGLMKRNIPQNWLRIPVDAPNPRHLGAMSRASIDRFYTNNRRNMPGIVRSRYPPVIFFDVCSAVLLHATVEVDKYAKDSPTKEIKNSHNFVDTAVCQNNCFAMAAIWLLPKYRG